MRLKRKWARLVIGLLAADVLLWGLVIALTGYVMTETWWFLGLLALAPSLLLVTLYLRLRLLLCPHCENASGVPQWKPGKRYYCPRCGKPFVYDDETDDTPNS